MPNTLYAQKDSLCIVDGSLIYALIIRYKDVTGLLLC